MLESFSPIPGVIDCQTADDVKFLARRVKLKAKLARQGKPVFAPLPATPILGAKIGGWRPEPRQAVSEAILTIVDYDETCVGAHIINLAAGLFRLGHGELLSRRRDPAVVNARSACMYVMTQVTPFSLPKIGALLGGRDHSTVIYALRRMKEPRHAQLKADYCDRLMQAFNAVPMNTTKTIVTGE